jgi:CRISPR-associated endonuclease/helicase Cas3
VEKEFYAHSIPEKPVETWQPLEEHLRNVAEKAFELAIPFCGGNLARLLGRYHDVGKGSLSWQAYLRKANEIADDFAQYYKGPVKHAIQGAQWLYEHSKDAGKLMAYCIAGHHGGLPNWHDSPEAALKTKLNEQFEQIEIPMDSPDLPERLPLAVPERRLFGFQIQFFVRMLYSCLVDADFLDTERTLDTAKAAWRSTSLDLSELEPLFWKNFNALRESAEKTNVNHIREIVLSDCIEAAKEPEGLFSLTVPTGGGKTLASLAFALEHAKRHQKSRIFYVIPFTSIIEQTAAVFRDMLGKDAVLEHHCNFVPDETDWKTRLSSENWDAPIVVTTNVQFFNSFYAHKPSKCRKLHNVANSVIIFDEVQAIPVEKLMPCLEVIKELSLNYKVTSVLCTATQPVIHYSEAFQSGLKDVREIVGDVPGLFKALKRTAEKFIGTLTEQQLSQKLADEEQVLCVVNTRQQALDVFNALPDSEDNIHLSALMYPVHRSRKLEEIRKRLEIGLPCRVISTQLIEAGVDVDFKCVFRAVCGIDSIAQAAGRCNRNGNSKKPLPVQVFAFPDEAVNSYFRKAAQSAKKLFKHFDGDLTSPDCVREYFLDYFWKNQHQMDEGETLEKCFNAQKGDIQFKDIAVFEVIKTATLPIVIAVEDEAVEMVKLLEFSDYPGPILRKLQQYSVQIYPYQLDEIHSWLETPHPGVRILRSSELYSDKTGLKCKPPEGWAFFG